LAGLVYRQPFYLYAGACLHFPIGSASQPAAEQCGNAERGVKQLWLKRWQVTLSSGGG